MRSETFLLALQLLLGISLPHYPDALEALPDPVLSIDLDEDTVVLTLDGIRYEVNHRHVVALDLPRSDTLHVVVDLPDDAVGLFVTIDGVWIDNIVGKEGGDVPLDFELLPPNGELGFEIAMPGQRAPTLPDVVIVANDDDPDPR
jgi:hypothetical protein